ncbi:MAG: transporter substrate-binding domain-containing protein [Spirochaetaceae bacterium]|jgi:putative glutamine transport system substrate-binding protein|nr:transporter substrate-binding domain-containing protein [Spirochaetaceae bacterium]
MKMSKMVFALCASVAVFSAAGCSKQQANGLSVEEIKKSGVLKVGVKSDVPGFGFFNTSTNGYEGFEIELAKLFASEILGGAGAANFESVTARTRGPLLDNGELDMVIATFTITDERKLTYNFSTPYYIDAVGMLVKRSSGINSLADLNGLTIGVAQSSTSKEAISTAAAALGITLNFAEFSTYPEIKAALDSGRVDVFAVDKSILKGYLDADTIILPDEFSPQPYGVTTKLSNKELADYVDGLVKKWLEDGTIAALITKFNL